MLVVPCRRCDDVVTVVVDEGAWMRFELRQGLVQSLFPSHTADEREAIMGMRNSGDTLCPACWLQVFGDDDDDTT
jgi:hypothetical protein